MVTTPRPASSTVKFIDDYCQIGWANYRLTHYPSIERWWELVYSAYLLVSLQAHNFQILANETDPSLPNAPRSQSQLNFPFQQHPWWEKGITWKSSLNNLRLLIQPYIFYSLISPWLQVFPIPGFRHKFCELIEFMNTFPNRVIPFSIGTSLVA